MPFGRPGTMLLCYPIRTCTRQFRKYKQTTSECARKRKGRVSLSGFRFPTYHRVALTYCRYVSMYRTLRHPLDTPLKTTNSCVVHRSAKRQEKYSIWLGARFFQLFTPFENRITVLDLQIPNHPEWSYDCRQRLKAFSTKVFAEFLHTVCVIAAAHWDHETYQLRGWNSNYRSLMYTQVNVHRFWCRKCRRRSMFYGVTVKEMSAKCLS